MASEMHIALSDSKDESKAFIEKGEEGSVRRSTEWPSLIQLRHGSEMVLVAELKGGQGATSLIPQSDCYLF